jgi:hypothetical protein
MISEEWKLVISFCSGLLANRLYELLKIKKVQKNITMFYDESIDEFQEAVNTIKPDDGEEKYLAVKEKLRVAKSNIQTLLSYSWSAERLKPKFFFKLQKKNNLIQEIEKTFPFNGKNHFSNSLDFLRRYQEEITPEHARFKNIFNELKIA